MKLCLSWFLNRQKSSADLFTIAIFSIVFIRFLIIRLNFIRTRSQFTGSQFKTRQRNNLRHRSGLEPTPIVFPIFSISFYCKQAMLLAEFSSKKPN